MKTKFLLALAATLLVFTANSQAGWGWGGGGYCGPRGGWGGGWGGSAFGITFAPVPIYRTVYVAQPAPYYTQRVVRVSRVSSTLVGAQSRLASLGYYRGTVDGSFGPLTSRAIAQYQADYGLPITGRLDRATVKSLGV